jgi:hypothetical protein
MKLTEQEYIEHATANGGMTSLEAACSYRILLVWESYLQLPVQHQDEEDEARTAIHALQNLMAMRVARRDHPLFWRNDEVTQEIGQ